MRRTLSQFAEVCGGRLLGADVEFADALIDSRKVRPGDLFLALPGERTDGHQHVAAAASAGAVGAVVSRTVDAAVPLIMVPDVERALARAGAAWRSAYANPVLGVAGSNGKTTTKEMLSAILSQSGECLATRGNLNNHLGVPLTLLRLHHGYHSAVIEMGANHAGEIAELVRMARPAVGLITNAGAEHLEGFGSLEGVARAEGEMVEGLESGGTAVINDDDEYATLWRSLTRARVVSFGLREGADVRALGVRLDVDARGFLTHFELQCALGSALVSLALAGRHNVYNALAAAAAAMAAGATLAQVVEGLASVRSVGGRLQFRPLAGGAWLIDDTYNANPSSARAALDVLAELPGRRWLVLGDMAELGEFGPDSHRELGRLARRLGIERLYTFGPLAALAAETFGPAAESHTDMNSLIKALGASVPSEVRLLVKGSRVNRLERLVGALTGSAAAARQAV
jgi:UDP-N-acetylmuramoyl-tripeptide--D-alanyl-D-alanine ligase